MLEAIGGPPPQSAGGSLLLEQLTAYKSPATLRRWMRDLHAHRRYRQPPVAAELQPLLDNRMLSEERSKLLLVFSSKRLIPRPAAVGGIIGNIRECLLEQTPDDVPTVLLAMILDASKLLRAYFPPNELEAMRSRLRSLQDRSGDLPVVLRQTRRAIDEIHVVMVTSSIG
ncbi:hypothetical protein GCM10020370_51480 [Paenibacillus hodogayensis]